jgi:hypothetical protein
MIILLEQDGTTSRLEVGYGIQVGRAGAEWSWYDSMGPCISHAVVEKQKELKKPRAEFMPQTKGDPLSHHICPCTCWM